MKSRQEAIVIARTYIGTPYHLGARLKGVGVDCATLLLLYLLEVEAVRAEQLEDFGPYRHSWFHGENNHRYLAALMKYAKLVAETAARAGVKPEPGNLVLFKVARSRVFNHGAIVTEWPFGVHAGQDGVKEVDLAAHWLTGGRPMDIFDPFARMAE